MIKLGKFGKSKIGNHNNLTALGGGAKGEKVKRQGTKGHYSLSFTRTMDNVTEKDVELKLDYGREFIYINTGVPRYLIKFQIKEEHQTLASASYVYYVRRGKETIGKLSIKVLRFGKRTKIFYVYQQKAYRPKGTRQAKTRRYTN